MKGGVEHVSECRMDLPTYWGGNHWVTLHAISTHLAPTAPARPQRPCDPAHGVRALISAGVPRGGS